MFAVEYKDMSFKYCDLHLIILRQFESFKRISKIHPLLCKKKKKKKKKKNGKGMVRYQEIK